MKNTKQKTFIFISFIGIISILGATTASFINLKTEYRTNISKAAGLIQHYLYVLPEGGTMSVYDMDNNHALVKTIAIPTKVTFIRGMAADPASHSLYIAYGGVTSSGQLMKMDLLTNQVIYDKSMPVGADSFDITANGKTIYMPDGDGQTNGIWRVVDTATGTITASIDTKGHNPHNTLISSDGSFVLMGPRLSNYLVMASTATNQIIGQIGPLANGVRPFTINSAGTLAYIETSGFIGFEVADIHSGKILYKVSTPGFSYDPASTFAPSHGISLSPDEKELYIGDWPNSTVHVFNVANVQTTAPSLITNIKVHNMVGNDVPCIGTNCQKEGWVLHSRDGRFVYVGDAGDVIDTATHQSVAFLQPLSNTRKFIEVDWQNGLPISTTGRVGRGYANAVVTPTPVYTVTPSAIIPTHSVTATPLFPTSVSVTHTIQTTPLATKVITTPIVSTNTQKSVVTSIVGRTVSASQVQTQIITPTVSTTINSATAATSFVTVKLLDTNNNLLVNAQVNSINSSGIINPSTNSDNNGTVQLPSGSKITTVEVDGKSISVSASLQGYNDYNLVIDTRNGIPTTISGVSSNNTLRYILYSVVIITSIIFIICGIILYRKRNNSTSL